MSGRHWEQNKEATVYVGNLDERFAEPLLWELMTQMGPVVNVHMPMDRVSRTHQGFGFVEFDTPDSADYAARCLNGIRLYGKPVRVNKASADRQRAADIGAELFVNNLDPQVDEKILYDTCAQFGRLVTAPVVVRDPQNNNVSKGYGFVSFDSFEAADAALAALHGQYLLSKQIAVEYAYKKDGKGERHGDEAERKLAAEGKKHNVLPEIQPLPPAFLMSRPPPPPLPPSAAAVPSPGVAPAASSANAIPLAQPPPRGPVPAAAAAAGYPAYPRPPAAQPGMAPYGSMPPGSMPPGSMPPGSMPPGGMPGGMPGGFPPGAPPPMPAGFGARAGGPAGPGLPMAPSGLPARPPPGFAAGAGSVPAGPPPALAGSNGMPPPPPPGFGRR